MRLVTEVDGNDAGTEFTDAPVSPRLIAVIGAGAIVPGANSVAEFWQNVQEGRDCISEMPARFEPDIFHDPDPDAIDKTYCKVGGFIHDLPFDPLRFRIPPNSAKVMDRVQKLLLLASAEAMKDSGYDGRDRSHERTALIIGNASGRTELEGAMNQVVQLPLFEQSLRKNLAARGYRKEQIEFVIEDLRERVLTRLPPLNEDSLQGSLRSVALGRVASLFDLHGPSYIVDSACASGLAAVDSACEGLLAGDFDLAISGGIHASTDALLFSGFSKFRGLSRDRVKPFDLDADGFLCGEGAVLFVLKRLEDARRDGDKIYAVIRGFGSSSDGREKGIGAPNPKAQALAMRRAFLQAGYSPGSVQLVETHGAGTPLGDYSEFEAILEVFGPFFTGERQLALSAVKSQIGHMMGGAGAVGLLNVVLGLHHRKMPVAINHRTPNPRLPWSDASIRVVVRSEPWLENEGGLPRRGNVSSFGFGGTNFHAAVEEYREDYHSSLLREKSSGTYHFVKHLPAQICADTAEESSSVTREPIAVVGAGAILPKAPDVDTFWQNILDGVSSIREVPEDHWEGGPQLFYDPNPGAHCKTHTLLGGFIGPVAFDARRFRIPPGTAKSLDPTQKLFMMAALAALEDAGYAGDAGRLNRQQTAVLVGGASGCMQNTWSSTLRCNAQRVSHHLKASEVLRELLPTPRQREELLEQVNGEILANHPPISEDTLLSLCTQIAAARFAKGMDLMGTHAAFDAACASSLAAIASGVRGLQSHKWEAVVAGGVSDGVTPVVDVLFSKAGITSATGSRPFDREADGFVPGEGAACFILKRLSEAVRDQDKIYAVIRGVGCSADGTGRAMMAPRPEGQVRCLLAAYEDAGFDKETVQAIECHATSTAVGDVVELEALRKVFGEDVSKRIGIGSVKSQIGHLTAAAGAAGFLKAVLGLHHRTLPPTLGVDEINPGLNLERSPFYLVTSPRPWPENANGLPRRAGVSSFGFGGTNWHIALEEFNPEYHTELVRKLERREEKTGRIDVLPGLELPGMDQPQAWLSETTLSTSSPDGGVWTLTAPSLSELVDRARAAVERLKNGEQAAGFSRSCTIPCWESASLARLAIAASDRAELADKLTSCLPYLQAGKPAPPLEARGIYFGVAEPAGRQDVCFLFPGQGGLYPAMWKDLYIQYPVVRATFAEANGVLDPLLGAPLEQLLFQAPGGLEELERRLLESDLAQPVLVTASVSMFRLLLDFGLRPAMLAGHSLGEYSALAAAGVISFPEALQAAYVRGREFRRLSQSSDPGRMAVVAAAAPDVEPILSRVRGYLAIANRNCSIQTVLSGATSAVSQAVSLLEAQGIECRMLPIVGAFHSAVARAIEGPMAEVLGRLTYHAPVIPLLSSVDNAFYAGNADIGREVRERLLRQLSHPVDFIGVVRQLYATGARLFVEVGPKKALSGFVSDILGGLPHRSLFTNHPKFGEIDQLNRVLAQFFVLGSRFDEDDSNRTTEVRSRSKIAISFKDSAMKMQEPKIVFSGAAVGLPGKSQRVFSDNGFRRLLAGHSMIDPVPVEVQDRMVDKNMLKVVKSGNGDSYFQKVEDRQGVIRLAGQYGRFDLKEDYGLDFDWLNGADITDRLAVAAGIECLNDAGIPLQRVFRKTSKGTEIPDGWALPAALQADTAVIFASIYAGLDNLLDEVDRYYRSKYGSAAADGVRAEYFKRLEQAGNTAERLAADRWFASETHRLQLLEGNGEYGFNRDVVKDFCCKANSLFAQLIRARGPNVHVDSACASQAVALALAEDMLRSGRARRVIVLSADVITSSRLLEWFGASFLAVGAAASDEHVTDAALPFDRRRHGLILGSGASAVMLETEDAVRARGMQPIAELLGTHASNSAFHMTRIDATHVADEMQVFMDRVERKHGLSREALAPKTMFMSHETYTPARGGSAQAEVKALKAAFGSSWRQVLVSNTKGMTGHCQGAGIENVAALRSLQYGLAPPVVNLEEQDPEFEGIRFSQGGKEELDYALGFSAGFGSHVAMFMLRAVCRDENRIQNEESYRTWISELTGLHDAETERVLRILRVREKIRENRSYDLKTVISPLDTPSSPVPGAPVRQTHEAPQGASSSLPPPQTSAGEVATASLHLPNRPTADDGPAHASPTTAALQSRSTTASPEEVLEVILSLVEEKTGYEREFLDLDLDLEADLGIDTIKQAQILGLVRDKYNLPREEGVRLKDFPTLRHVVTYIAGRVQGSAQGLPEGLPGESPPSAPAPAATPLMGSSTGVTAPASPLLPADDAVPIEDEIREVVLSLVEEKTGYEREFLDLDLDLEADLGIDTIKQAQILGLIRDRYSLEREEGIRLKDFPTLRHVIGYIVKRVESASSGNSAVREAVQGESPGSGPQPAPPDEYSEGDSTGSPAWTMLRRSVVRLKETPLPDSLTRLRLLPGHSVVVTDDGLGIASALKKRLEEYGIKAVLLDAGMPGYDERRHGSEREEPEAWQELVDQVAGVTRPVQGVIHLAPLAAEAAVSVKTLAEWRMANTRETRACFLLAKELQEELIKSQKTSAFFCAVTALGGDLGLEMAPGKTGRMVRITHGGVSGLVKTLALEMPGTSVKVVDFDAGEARRRPGKLAALLFQEIVAASPDVEVAYKEGRRYLPCLVDAPLDLGSSVQVELDTSSVVVLFGGGRGITAEIAKDLAASFRCHLVLFGLTELDDDVRQFAALSPEERAKVRRGLFEELRKKDPRLTPAQMDAVFQRKVRGAEIHNNIEAIRAQGGSPEYRVCDVRDPREVQSRLNEILSRFGRLDGIVFGAGIIEDKLLEDKNRQSFDRVFDIKADGALNLFHALRATPGMRPKFIALFASIAGRFGNRGQIDYSAANALLDKFPLLISSEMPGTRCFSIDWTAWEEVGLPARSGLVQVMKEQGMDVISPPEGAEAFRNELLFGSATEVIYAGSLPGLTDGWLSEGRLPPGEVSDLPTLAPLLDVPEDYARGARLKVRKILHPGTDPWLLDHVINGVPVLPGVIGIEMMAEAGRLLFPDFHFVGLDDLEIRLAVKILKDRPARLIVEAQAHTTRRGDERKVRVRIDSEFVDPRGKKQTRQHYEAVVVLDKTAPERPHSTAVPVGVSAEQSLLRDVIYGRNHYLPHGPAFQVLQSIQVLDEKSAIGRVAPVSEAVLFPKLNGYRLATTPLLREAGFQVAGLWAILKPGILSLPSGCRQLRHFGSPPEHARLLARATNLRQTEEAVEYDLEILDENGTVYDLMRRYRAVPVASIAEE